jgi:hypothetical protein
MSDKNEDAGTRGRGDAEEAGRGDGETGGRGDAQELGRGDGETGGRGDEQAPESVDAETRGRGDADKTDEAFLASEVDLTGSTEATASDVGEPQAALAVEQAALAESSVDEPPPSAVDRRKSPRGPRPSLVEEREPVFHDEGGYRLRMDPADLAKLRELPGAKGKTDRELGEEFFKGQSARLVASMADDVQAPAEVRVVVDPYSRQAFLAVGRTIRGIVSF